MNLFILLINLLILICVNAKKNCTSTLIDEADEAFGKVVLYGDKSFSWGSTENDIKNICKSVQLNKVKVKKYLKNCTSGISLQLIGLILKGASTQVKKFCTPNKEKNVLKYTKCGNSDLVSDHLCMDQFVLRLKEAAINLPDDLKLGASCCSFTLFENCIVNRMEKESKCTKEDVEFFRNLVHGTTNEAMEFGCSEYNSNQLKCDEIIQNLDKLDKEKTKKSEVKGKSIMLPLITVVKMIT